MNNPTKPTHYQANQTPPVPGFEARLAKMPTCQDVGCKQLTTWLIRSVNNIMNWIKIVVYGGDKIARTGVLKDRVVNTLILDTVRKTILKMEV